MKAIALAVGVFAYAVYSVHGLYGVCATGVILFGVWVFQRETEHQMERKRLRDEIDELRRGR